MRPATWFMLLLVVCQLGLGSAWAHVAMTIGPGHASATLADDAPAHCHEVSVGDVETGVTADLASASCCSATHCQWCSAVGLFQAPEGVAAMPTTALLTDPSVALVSWSHRPELRPPI